jgi:hypothetical protein
MDPKEVYKTYKAEVEAAKLTMQSLVNEATSKYVATVADANGAYIAAMDEAVAHFRENAK